MKPAPLDYVSVSTVKEAIDVLQKSSGEGKIVAGGQSLVPMMNMRVARPSVVVDIGPAKELEGITKDDRELRVGATVRQQALLQYVRTIAHWDLLAEGMRYIGHPQTRSMGTVGGSIAHADPSAELPLLLATLGGFVEIRGACGVRSVSAGDFFRFPFVTALEPEEVLVATRWPRPAPGTTSSFREFARRRGDFAVVAVAVTLSRDSRGRCLAGRLGVAGAGGVPVVVDLPDIALSRPWHEEFTRQWISAVDEQIDPPDDLMASSDFRRQLVRVLGKEAIHEAVQSERGG